MGFKERLKEKRLEAGLTQAELAEKVSVTTRTIQNYELGSRKPGNMKVIGDIATVLGTTADYLLSEDALEGAMRALNDAYWMAKERNKKFTPKKYRQQVE